MSSACLKDVKTEFNGSLLIVDDEPGIRNVLEISLKDKGYTVYTARDAASALEILLKHRPPVVLTDIKMPEMDGIELLKRIKKISPETEVIMFTGHGDMDLAIQSMKNDACDFVTKPIDDDILQIAINRATERILFRKKIRQYTKNLEALVKEKTERLLEAEKMAAVGEAIAGLSHTIKNIAGGLKAGIFMIEQYKDQKEQEYFEQGWEMIKANVDKIFDLSLDLLNFGRYTSINPEPCSIELPVKEAVRLMSPYAEQAGTHLDCQFAGDLPECIIDSEAICRCIVNLLSNAIDACADSIKKEKKVTITTRLKEDGHISVVVEDNGEGMDENIARRLFTAFFSTKGSRGTGIGLLMTKKIVELHKGSIVFCTTKGEGSRFEINIPG